LSGPVYAGDVNSRVARGNAYATGTTVAIVSAAAFAALTALAYPFTDWQSRTGAPSP
jgi:predicted outer membrane lipoprotein